MSLKKFSRNNNWRQYNSVMLIALMLWLSMSSILHFAQQRHIYCRLHNQVEDYDAELQKLDDLSRPQIVRHEARLHRRGYLLQDNGELCVYLELIENTPYPTHNDLHAFIHATSGKIRINHTPLVPSQGVLGLAPKHSPPLYA